MAIKKIQFIQAIETQILNPLKKAWKETLTAPQDGMWEALTGYAQHWEIKKEDQLIGYASVDDEERLLQFFLLPHHLQEGASILAQFLREKNVSKALIGTNNPVCLSLVMQLQKSVRVDTCLFTDHLSVSPPEHTGTFRPFEKKNLEKLVEFYHVSMNGPKDWLLGYLGDLLEKGEIFVLEEGDEILGACEVRKSTSQAHIADLGMVVSPQHRKKGLGTYLLGKAKEVALSWERKPICSCEIDNIGSLKSIQNNGFRSIHQMLALEF